MRKIFHVASREFLATVTTKGFVFGILFTPVLVAVMIFLMPRLMNRTPEKVEGQVIVVDATGVVADGLEAYLSPERFAERRDKTRREIEAATPSVFRKQAAANPAADAAVRQSLDSALGAMPVIHVVKRPAGSDLEAVKTALRAPLPKQGGGPDTVLAAVVVQADAVKPAGDAQAFGTYDVYVRGKIDDRLVDDIHSGLRDAIVAARLEGSGLDPARIRSLTVVPRPATRTVTDEGERTTSRELNMLMPMGFMVLLLMSVMTSGQYLLTSTVEEKSNRVVEVLLSAVSAMELMTGKILGQMAVGLLVLALYAGLGLVALISFATLGLIDPMLIVFLAIFYVLGFFTFAAFMAAVGAAVNEMREAQSLMMPIMIVLMVPWMLWLPLTREPNSMLAIVLSFAPPFSTFVMLLRMASQSPPPMWQAWLSVVIGAGGVYASLWFAAKVFRVGLLMYGKPPTFGTLVRWARMS